MQAGTKSHKFERAGLGVAPFRFVGTYEAKYQACHGAPIQPGASCDYCGTGISRVFVVKDSTGKEFKVGSECVRHTGDAGVIDEAKRAAREIERARRSAKATERIRLARLALRNDAGLLTDYPHPRGFVDRATGDPLTLRDWAEWMLANAGTQGKVQAARVIEADLAKAGIVLRAPSLEEAIEIARVACDIEPAFDRLEEEGASLAVAEAAVRAVFGHGGGR